MFLSEGRLMQQAERGWAGNHGRMGWVGETTASSHQYRCRYLIVVVVDVFVVVVAVVLSGRVMMHALPVASTAG